MVTFASFYSSSVQLEAHFLNDGHFYSMVIVALRGQTHCGVLCAFLAFFYVLVLSHKVFSFLFGTQ